VEPDSVFAQFLELNRDTIGRGATAAASADSYSGSYSASGGVSTVDADGSALLPTVVARVPSNPNYQTTLTRSPELGPGTLTPPGAIGSSINRVPSPPITVPLSVNPSQSGPVPSYCNNSATTAAGGGGPGLVNIIAPSPLVLEQFPNQQQIHPQEPSLSAHELVREAGDRMLDLNQVPQSLEPAELAARRAAYQAMLQKVLHTPEFQVDQKTVSEFASEGLDLKDHSFEEWRQQLVPNKLVDPSKIVVPFPAFS